MRKPLGFLRYAMNFSASAPPKIHPDSVSAPFPFCIFIMSQVREKRQREDARSCWCEKYKVQRDRYASERLSQEVIENEFGKTGVPVLNTQDWENSNASCLFAGNGNADADLLTEGGFVLVKGAAITSANKNSVLIHEKFAGRNGLSVGDTLRLTDVADESRAITVTVAGIFTNTKEQDAIGIVPSYDLYDNMVFTDLSTASYLLYGTEGETSVQYGDFYVDDPDELDRIMAEVAELEGVNWDNCTLTRYDNDYQNAKASLAGLQNIVFLAIAVVSVICFLVLALFLTLRLRGRVHETGVYLAMGISKGAVLLQYLLEVLIVAVIALLLSYGAGAAISDQIGSRLLSQDYALVWGFGLVLCLASTALAAYPILKMKPKNILSQMS